MRSVPNYPHPYILIFVFILFRALGVSASTLSATESLTISSNKTIISHSELFELGFFTPASSSRWYLGIWYKKIPTRTYVWVANRDTPLSHSNGSLKISSNNLVIFDHSNKPVWSTNLTGGNVRSPVVAELLDNGNFVLRDSNNNEYLWQSFHFPTDTLLPDMKLGWDLKSGRNRFLRSRKAPDDPSSGDYSTKFETRGFPEVYVCNKESIVYRSGPWDGIRFNGIPEVRPVDYLVLNFSATEEEITYSYHITKSNIYSILTLTPTGLLQRSTWVERLQSWRPLWYSPRDICNNYEQCGYGYCDSNTSPVCNCIHGFKPRNKWDLRDDFDGCVRKTRLSCDGTDGFVRLKNMKLPDTTKTIVDRGIGIEECEARCLKHCNCTAFANTDIRNGGSGCVIWTGDMLDIRYFAEGGQDLYVRLAAADLG
uniref:S-locus glycoprotein n=2 Tax=Brassica oleracea var. oleracea TaxID=109376 RepID=A0A0D3CY99_BRAOL